MCGIIGCLYQDPLDAETLGLRMLERIRYRGPDHGYLHLENKVFLGIRRLAIVNVDQGDQPAFSENGNVVAVFNGEIYNHRELKAELLAKGFSVQDGSDAEIIPHAYQQWGLDFPNHLNGDFAIAIWDRSASRLILARDRLGIKPLFFAPVPQGLVWASEVKALWAHPEVPRQLNTRYLGQLFTYWTGLDPQSAFEGVYQIEAGQVVVFHENGRQLTSRKYWEIPCQLSVPRFHGTFEECKEAFRGELQKSVALRLQADVPVGTYTSGGIDSSIINVLAYQDLNHRETQTFSVAFEDQVFDESVFQEEMVRHLQLNAHQVRCRGLDIYNHFPDVIGHTEAPVFRTAPVPMFLLSRCVSNAGLKVVLTGEGADEVAWGYDVFREAKIRQFWSRQPNSEVRGLLFRKLYAYLPQFQNPRHFRLLVDFFRQDMQLTDQPLYSHQMRITNSRATHLFLHSDLKKNLVEQDPLEQLIASLPADYQERTLLEKCQYLEMRTLLRGYLLSSQGDRMLSAHGVEGRFPFLDHHVIEFLAGVPERFRLRGLRDKHLLRETFRSDLPQKILERPKFAFRAPEVGVFIQDPDGMVEHHLNPKSIDEAGVFDASAVQRFRTRLAQVPEGRFSTRDNLAFVQMLSTQVLYDRFVRGAVATTPAERRDVTITHGNKSYRQTRQSPNSTRRAA